MRGLTHIQPSSSMPCWGVTCHRLPCSSSSACGTRTDPHMKALSSLASSQRCCHSHAAAAYWLSSFCWLQCSQPTTAYLQRHRSCNSIGRFTTASNLSCPQGRTCRQQLAGREKAATDAGGHHVCLYRSGMLHGCCSVPTCTPELSLFPDQQPSRGHTSSTAALLDKHPAAASTMHRLLLPPSDCSVAHKPGRLLHAAPCRCDGPEARLYRQALLDFTCCRSKAGQAPCRVMQAPSTCSCVAGAHLEAGAGHDTRLLAHCRQLVQGHGGEADEAQQLSQVPLPHSLRPHPLEHRAEHVVLAPPPQGVAAQQLAQRGKPAGAGRAAGRVGGGWYRPGQCEG